MTHDPSRLPSRAPVEPALRELLVFLRDTFRDAATRIDRYLGDPGRDRDSWIRSYESDRESVRPKLTTPDPAVRIRLEALREEARQISQDAPGLESTELRLRIEAVTAETRGLQNRAVDLEERELAAKILRVLTAIVSEHRPGHVYGLARHHQADWDELARKARSELGNGPRVPGAEDRAPETPSDPNP